MENPTGVVSCYGRQEVESTSQYGKNKTLISLFGFMKWEVDPSPFPSVSSTEYRAQTECWGNQTIHCGPSILERVLTTIVYVANGVMDLWIAVNVNVSK